MAAQSEPQAKPKPRLPSHYLWAALIASNLHFPGPNYPASTLVGVTALAMDGLMIEVEAVAIVE